MDEAWGNQDAEWCRAWQRGDPAAFAALVRRWEQPLARFLAALVGQADLVPDLCQEVFLRVFLARGRYREKGAFASWLYRIAYNVGRDEGRRRRLHLQRLPDGDLEAPQQEHKSAPEQQELAKAVGDALAELPLPLREVIVLRHYAEMNFKEIATLLGVPTSTLRSRFEVGMNRLRIRLKQQGWSPQENEP